MIKEIDPLLNRLLTNVLNLQIPATHLNKVLLSFGNKKVSALREAGFLKDAPIAKFIGCPEEGCERCTITVQIDHDDLFGYCSQYDDIARIPLKMEDATQSQIDFSKIATKLAESLGKLPLNREQAEQFDICYLNGHTLFLSAGTPVELCVEEKRMALSEAMRWTGELYCFRVDQIQKLTPDSKGMSESVLEKRCRYLLRFMELRKQTRAAGARQQIMAEEYSESESNIRRVLNEARNSHAVSQRLGLPHLAKTALKDL